MSNENLQDTLDQIGVAFDEFKRRNNERIGQLEADINAGQFRAGGDPSKPRIPREFDEELRALGKGKQKQMSVTTTAAEGGNAAATVLGGILETMRRTSPMLDLVRVVPSTTGQYKHVVTDDALTSGWIGEGSSRTASTTPTFYQVTPTGAFCYSLVQLSEEASDDIQFPIGQFLIDEVGRSLGKQIGAAIVSGNGSDQPTGFLHGTPSSTGDEESPARAFGTIQYFPTGATADFQNDRLTSPAGDAAGCLFDCLYGLHSSYRANSTWCMNSTVLSKVRKFRDSDGDYLFKPGLTSGDDGTLLGRPIRVAEDMPNVGANAFPIAIADWNMAYLVVQVGDMRVTIDDNVSTPGFIRYYVRQRLLGHVLQSDAVKVVKCATS